jgi:hypothetical protein
LIYTTDVVSGVFYDFLLAPQIFPSLEPRFQGRHFGRSGTSITPTPLRHASTSEDIEYLNSPALSALKKAPLEMSSYDLSIDLIAGLISGRPIATL